LALKFLLLRKKYDDKNKALEDLKLKENEFSKREKELETAILEINDDTSDEDKKTIEEQIENFNSEKAVFENEQKVLEKEVLEIENEIKKEEERQKLLMSSEKREGEFRTMETRKFFNLTSQERDAFFAREDVKDFLTRTREIMKQKRAITGVELTIPTVVLEIIRENILKYSKLINKVRTVSVSGKARQTIMGTVPEAVWTEMCAKLNELSIAFNQVEVDGYKVGGFIAVCNALIEDSDVALASEIISAIGQSIGYALDKAILYGTGNKMPLGIVTRLAQTAAGSDHQSNDRDWLDLHTSNVLKIDSSLSESKFYSALIKAAGAAKSKYSRGAKFWAMNESTYSAIMAKSVVANMSGAFVSSINGTMPIIGGDIVVLDFIADNDIIGGYGDLYLLAERAATNLAQSTECKFIEDQTVFRGTARYDGTPVIPEGFVAININNAAVTTSVTFAPDTANTTTDSGLTDESLTDES
jgi:HK97 family phage major capsid protein